MDQAKQVAGMGAVIEVCFLQFLTGPNASQAWMTQLDQHRREARRARR